MGEGLQHQQRPRWWEGLPAGLGRCAPGKGVFLNRGLSALQQKITVTGRSEAGGEADAVHRESSRFRRLPGRTRCKPGEARANLNT